LCVIAPLDPNEGDRYNDPMDEDVQISSQRNIHHRCKEYYVNPTVDGELSWRSVLFYDTDSKDAMDRWQINYMRYQLEMHMTH
jgi:hypothetical protein